MTPVEGRCRCSRTRMRVSAPPLLTAACHCRGCQRMTASAFSLTVAIPSEGFEVTAGEPVPGGQHGAEGEGGHFMCPHCMSWMFTRIEGMPFVNVRSVMLDDAAFSTPFMETQTAEKLPWVTTPAVRSFERFPEDADYEGLIGDYQRSVSPA